MKYKEERYLLPEDLCSFCVQNGLYNLGTVADYEELLDKLTDNNGFYMEATTELLQEVAINMLAHTQNIVGHTVPTMIGMLVGCCRVQIVRDYD